MGQFTRLVTILILASLIAAACSGSGEVADPVAPTPTLAPAAVEALGGVAPTPTPEPPPDNAIKVGVLLDVGNLDVEDRDPGNVMSPLDRQPGIAFGVAVDAINASGGLLGRPISIIDTDTTSRLSVIDSASKSMIEQGVDLIVVTCEFDFAVPAITRAQVAGVLVMSPCASERGWATGQAGELAFSMVASADTYGIAMADYAWEQGFRDVAVLSDSTAPEARAECGAFSERWSDLGGTFAYVEAFGLRASETLDENLTIRSAGDAEVIILCAFRTIGLKLLAGVRLLGMTGPILASPSLDSGTWLPIDITALTDGAGQLGDFRLFTLASVWGDDPSPLVADAIDLFFNNQATAPSSGRFVVGSDLADLWSQAVILAGTTDGTTVARELRAMRDVQTVSGNITFGGSQAPEARELRVMRHENGTLVFEQLVTAGR